MHIHANNSFNSQLSGMYNQSGGHAASQKERERQREEMDEWIDIDGHLDRHINDTK